jgi:hypothetical protein
VRPLPLALVAWLALSGVATAAPPLVTSFNPQPPARPLQVVPGLSYQRIADPGQVVHVLRLRPGPRLALTLGLTGSVPTSRATLTSAVRARLAAGVVAGVNADYFNLAQGFPSGLLLVGGEVWEQPEPSRSALLIGPNDALSVARIALAGRWQAIDPTGAATFPVHTFSGVNRPAQLGSEIILYSSRFGPATPVAGSRYEATIALAAGVVPAANAAIAGSVVAARSGGGSPIAPNELVLTGVGSAGPTIARELLPGRQVSLGLGMTGLPPGVLDGIGGGPVLVQNGTPIADAGEGFTSSQLVGRTARTAVGQAADGTVLLVTAEGPDQGSRGITVAEQAQLMASLGARTAIGMDSGGSALMAVGDRLVIPWASERPISDALFVGYSGVQLGAPPAKLSPNGDGVDESANVPVRVPTAGRLVVTLRRRGGSGSATLLSADVPAGGRLVPLRPAALGLSDGPYAMEADLTPADGTPPSSQVRPLILDRTLAALRLRPVRGGSGRGAQAQLRIAFHLTRAAAITVRIEDSAGRTLRTLRSGRRTAAGDQLVVWDRTIGSRPAAGIYVVAVEARTSLGRTGLQAAVTLNPPSGR